MPRRYRKKRSLNEIIESRNSLSDKEIVVQFNLKKLLIETDPERAINRINWMTWEKEETLIRVLKTDRKQFNWLRSVHELWIAKRNDYPNHFSLENGAD